MNFCIAGPRLRQFLAISSLLLLISSPGRTSEQPLADLNGASPNSQAERIITLAPHLAELVFTAGAGDRLVASVAYSDYPDEVTRLPQIGDAFRFDLERIIALEPDLVIAWESGNPAAALVAMEDLGLNVWRTEIRQPDDIATLIRSIGQAAGTQISAELAGEHFEQTLERLRSKYRDVAPVSYFYQVAEQPLYTVSGQHLISQGLDICSAQNIFDELAVLAPQVTPEAVILANPDVMLAGRLNDDTSPLAHWRAWSRLAAVRDEALFYLPADQINRATPRLLDAIEIACNLLAAYRTSRPTLQAKNHE